MKQADDSEGEQMKHKIYCFNNGGKDGWMYAVAIADDGYCEESERRKTRLRNEHHGECPWCRAHPHREPCSPNCRAARAEKEHSNDH